MIYCLIIQFKIFLYFIFIPNLSNSLIKKFVELHKL